jgi:hypothetical protein
VNCRKRPCAECPWVRDTPSGQFPAERYVALRHTTGDPGREAYLGAPMFACHKSTEANTMPCAGWLASVGYESLTVRMLLISGEIPKDAMQPGDDWPELFESYPEMAEAQARSGSVQVGTRQR